MHKLQTTLQMTIPAGKTLLENEKFRALLNAVFLIVVVTVLSRKILDIGWQNLVSALPSSPLFYFIAILLFFVPIVSEVSVYSLLTGSSQFKQISIFIRKHVYNEALFSYAGEVFLVDRLAKIKGQGFKSAAIMVKDAALVRTFVANIWLLILLALAVLLGKQNVFNEITNVSPYLLLSAVAVSTWSVGLLLLFFRKISRLTPAASSKVASIYLMRSGAIAGLQILQWWLILPAVAFSTWFIILVIYALAKKSPVGGDLVFLAVVLSLPEFVEAEATIAALLLASVGTIQLLYFSVFVGSWLIQNTHLRPVRQNYAVKFAGAK